MSSRNLGEVPSRTHASPIANLGTLSHPLPPIGVGCGRIHESPFVRQVLQIALSKGATLWDTADVYGDGVSEVLVGEFLRRTRRRNEVFLATKGGLTSLDGSGRRVRCGRPDYLRTALDASLRRLRTDYLDLYYLHRIDPTVPVLESIGAIARSRDEGKVRFIGVSHPTRRELAELLGIGAIDVVQADVSIVALNEVAENGLWHLCSAHHVPLVSAKPLGGGLLASVESVGPPARRAYRDCCTDRLVSRYREAARVFSLTTVGLALGYLAAKAYVIPIPGTLNPAHLDQNIRCALRPLEARQVQRVEQIWIEETNANSPDVFS